MMPPTISQEEFYAEMRGANPRLAMFAPLTHYICWTYAIANILLGAGMYFLYTTTIPIAIASILSYQVWGGMFFSLGLMGIYFLMTNRWMMVRRMQLVGLALKSIWAIALVFRCFQSPQTIVITVVWLLFAAVQAGVFVYFLPSRLAIRDAT